MDASKIGVVVAVIPAHNEARTISEVVRRTKRHVDKVIVIDDGSTDDTAVLAARAGAIVISQENRGPGAATLAGVRLAAWIHDADIIVCLDGDGQHDPEVIPKFRRTLEETGSIMVVGRRKLSLGSIPFLRWLGNAIFFCMRNVGSSQIIHDGECGYRAFRASTTKFLDIQTSGFGFCEEMVIKARRIGRITEIDIPTIYGDEIHKYSFRKAMKRGLEIPAAIIRWRWYVEFQLRREDLTWEQL